MFRDTQALKSRSSHRTYIVKFNPANFSLDDLSLISFYDRGFAVSLQRVQVSSTVYKIQASTESFRVYAYTIQRLTGSNIISEALM